MELLRPWLTPALIFVAAVVTGYVVRTVLMRRLKAFFAETETKLDDLFLEAIEPRVPFWFLLAGVAAAAQASPLAENYQALAHKLVVAGFFVSVTMAVSQFASGAVRIYSEEFTAAGTSLAENLTQITVMVMGALLLLSNLGITITPILTALGVGSLAVALALQDTLSNLFAGIHIVAGRLVKVGDHVKLESGHEGTVVDVAWRTTRLQEPGNNYILIPNVKVSQAILVNFHQPEPEVNFAVPLGVAYGSDLAKVERVAVEVASEVLKTVPGGVPGFEPLVRYNAFADSSINFNVILRSKTLGDKHLLTHEFIKLAHARFQKEGIEIPYPQRVVYSVPLQTR